MFFYLLYFGRCWISAVLIDCGLQVLDTPEPLRNLAELIAAQVEYHRQAFEILSELAPAVDSLQMEQEVCLSILCVPDIGELDL